MVLLVFDNNYILHYILRIAYKTILEDDTRETDRNF